MNHPTSPSILAGAARAAPVFSHPNETKHKSMNSPKSIFAGLLPAAFLCLAGSSVQAAVVLTDNFNYTGWNSGDQPMTAVWTGSTVSVLAADETLPGRMRVANGYAYAALGVTLTSDFEVSVKMLPSAYQRMGWVGLTDATGSAGYAFMWDSSTSSSYSGQGFVRIGKFTPETAGAINWNVTASSMGWSALSLAGTSGHNSSLKENAAITAPMAEMKFTWSSLTGTLTLSIDGKQVFSVTDTSLGSFSRIYLGGGNIISFADLVVSANSIPEPGATAMIFSAMALGGAWWLRSRHGQARRTTGRM
ncbi:MAG: hypothetical protein LBK99_07880 [Opitutaceae bacterium]|jgi:hypothetical protein|nr:hypothetical protein [Opitutaceae bacterium]